MQALALLLAMTLQDAPQEDERPFGVDDVRTAGEVVGLPLDDDELELMLDGVIRNLRSFERMREYPLDNSVPPALIFDPWIAREPEPVKRLGTGQAWAHAALDAPVKRPAELEALAFADLATLAALIRSRQVSCVELTTMYLERLRRIDETLHCVVTFTEERALARAKALDAELDLGNWRGPLHGIPWGAKDLLTVDGYRTTWGAKPFEEQVLEGDAAVVEALDEAGAVLIAKLTLGALAWGDVWFDGKTRNPWNPEQGSSGSSAGSSSATAAGGVAFSIGSETWGSIVSPSERCGNSSLRPTFGRVSRHGAMALSWSLDKLGPICRSAQDAALVLEVIAGADPRDPSTLHHTAGRNAGKRVRRVGFFAEVAGENERYAAFLDELKELEIQLVPFQLPEYPVGDMMVLLNCEAASAFDELTRSGRDDELTRQVEMAWPNVFRHAQLVPAVEYLRANRLRVRLMRDMATAMEEVDVYVHPSFATDGLTATNLTGHPSVVLPYDFRENGTPTSITFTGQLYEDERLLRFAHSWQESTEHHLRHPELR